LLHLGKQQSCDQVSANKEKDCDTEGANTAQHRRQQKMAAKNEQNAEGPQPVQGWNVTELCRPAVQAIGELPTGFAFGLLCRAAVQMI
jgi:hypothetical protein